MSIGYFNQNIPYYNSNFRGSVTTPNAPEFISKPIEKVDKFINNTVDTFVKQPEDEEKKKTHKTAITAGSTVLVLSALVALLNPKFSGKLINSLKSISRKAGANGQDGQQKFLKKFIDVFQFTNSLNASKDLGFKWLCTAEKFKNVKNDSARNFLQTCDSGFRKVMSKVHSSITNGFDSISKNTVYRKYNATERSLSEFDEILKQGFREKLSPKEQLLLDEKLKEIAKAREYFSKNQTAERFKLQEQSMANIEKDFSDKLLNDFVKNFKGFKDKGSFSEKTRHNYNHIQNNMSFWAEDMLMPTRNKFEKDGELAIDVLFGDGKKVRGKYYEILDLLAPRLKQTEKADLEQYISKLNTKLTKANKTECVEYFDKKRDLMLGSAPLDIITGVGAIGLSGVAIGTADTKEDRISRALTLGFPAIAGIGSSLTLTAMLFSGVESLVWGSVASTGLSIAGSSADRIFNPKAHQKIAKNKTKTKPAETKPVESVPTQITNQSAVT